MSTEAGGGRVLLDARGAGAVAGTTSRAGANRRPVLPAPTPRWFRDGFLRFNRRLLGRRFAAVRAAHVERFPSEAPGPVLAYLNHPAWWDPLVCASLVGHCSLERRNIALIDEANLSGVLARLGFVGIEPGSSAGARRLSRLGAELAEVPGATLWLTPQGRFADPRERPLRLAGGLARLAGRLPGAIAVPVAVEYPFLGGRKPEARLLVGTPILAEDVDPAQLEGTLEAGLTDAMDTLAGYVTGGEDGPFLTLVGPGAARA